MALTASGLLVVILPGVVAAETDGERTARCIGQAEAAMGVDIRRAQFDDIVLGTSGDDAGMANPPGPTLICGFGGADTTGYIGDATTLIDGDIFVGGSGDDYAQEVGPPGAPSSAVFVGGVGNDTVGGRGMTGTFFGGPGDDTAGFMREASKFVGGPGDDVAVPQLGGIFQGGDGNDTVRNYMEDGLFRGGDGNDTVHAMVDWGRGGGSGEFRGGRGADHVDYLCVGKFLGGKGRDSVDYMDAGMFSGARAIDSVTSYWDGTLKLVEDVTKGPHDYYCLRI